MNKILLITFLLFEQNMFGQNTGNYSQQWNAKDLFETSTSQGLKLSGKGIVLDDQILIEDDGPASGYSSNPGALEIIGKNIQIKKILKIKKLPVKEAYIAALLYPEFPATPNNGRHIVINLNGHEIIYEVNHFWTKIPVPVEYLKTGDNIIIIKTLEPDAKFKTYVSLDENYKYGSETRSHSSGRSFKSSDKGKTWSKNLGINSNVSGEYSVRLKLIGYKSEGWLLSPVIDAASNSNVDKIISLPVKINNMEIFFDKINFEKLDLNLKYRTGTSPFFINTNWTKWNDLPADRHGLIQNKIPISKIKGRYLQLKFIFTSDSGLASSVLKKISIKSDYEILACADKNLQVLDYKNYPLIHSSFSFEYENPHFEKIQEFRKKYKLDEVVKDAKTEFEKMLKLKTWVASQWNWHLLKPDKDLMDWNADKILTPDASGEKGGFCANYAIVLMQALQSFGFPARFVIMNYSVWGGHEVVEAWSNDFGKWIMLDANYDTYFADPKTKIPYNVLELHNIFLKEYYSDSTLNRDDWSRENFVKKAEKIGKNVPVICLIGGGANGGTLKEYQWWLPTVELYAYSPGLGFLNAGFLHYMPRSNFLSQPYPIPINEGRTHWPWTGYYNWYDSQTPPTVEHETFTNRVNDLYWNLNEVDFSASYQSEEILSVKMQTNSPAFDHYEVSINDKKNNTKENSFKINLENGINNIKMRVIDSMGNKGPFSYLNLKYQ